MGTGSNLFRKSTCVMTVVVFLFIAAAVALAAVSQIPLYLTTNNQLNIMILLDNSLSMTENVNGTPKIQSARTVVSNLVKSFPGIRFGLTVFNPYVGLNADGGKVVMPCGGLTAANVDATMQGISADSYTPLGETLAEIWQYFKGGKSSYNSGVTYTSPITASCQQSFTIIVTDGEPTGDNRYKDDFSSYGWNPNDDVRLTTTHLPDVAQYMHTHPAVAAFPNSTITTYTVGFDVNSPILQTTAANGGGQYFTAANEAALASALNTVVTSIIGMVSSASAAAVNTAYLTTSTKLYRASFNSSDWSGNLEAFNINQTTGDVGTRSWDAASLLNGNTSRNIYTASTGGSRRIDFTTGNAATLSPAGFMNFSSSRTATMIGYVRGDTNPAGYRNRPSKLGDITYSSPVVYGAPDGFYTDHNYSTFKRNNASRQSLVLAGANDGMLHAFNADNGNEQWAFIPNSLLPKLKLLRNVPYSHTNYVNGPITIGDAYFASKNLSGTPDSTPNWHSVAVVGLREGGKSYFALDITDPANPVPLWEFNASSSNGLGYSFATPLIIKVRDKSQPEGFRWVAALANGYEGTTSGKAASLIFVDIATGAIVSEIVVDTSPFSGVSPNGLATPAAIDVDGDGYVDYLYAGDLTGDLWKFDVTNSDPGKWDVPWKSGNSPVALFRAINGFSRTQPITTAPDVVLRGGFQIVFFGTGKYYEAGDLTNTDTQSFYGVYDYNLTVNPNNTQKANGAMLARSDLTAQALSQVDLGGNSWRVVTNNPIGTNSGWYVDLPAGERVITDSIARSRKIIFTSFSPNTTPCGYGGTSWLMELNMDTGGTPPRPVFDVNGDGMVASNDTVSSGGQQVSPSGMSLGDGIASAPAIVRAGGSSELEYKYITKSSGVITKVLEAGGGGLFGLRSWKQVK
ncbi:pilus assembly protein [Geobacter pickeringii]|uniref:Pilus assembly protein PilY n=1 Tax=Geobacter pickeringii TaxID=345632 RepID=A0A0B5B858_9BACT|nr:PilC/PilY family type IV pilus protein [Geobacter pickeringii]AJE02823.1 pilus assembly protein PilY [Geobacter pickeringii]